MSGFSAELVSNKTSSATLRKRGNMYVSMVNSVKILNIVTENSNETKEKISEKN